MQNELTIHPAKSLRRGYVVIQRGALETIVAAELFDRAHAEKKAAEIAAEKGLKVGHFVTVK